LEVEAIEEHFLVELVTPKGRKFYVHGYVDLRGVKEGKRWLWDHKSGQKFIQPTESLMDPQLPYYAAAYRLNGIDVFGVCYNMLNTYPYVKKEAVSPEKLFKREYNFIPQEQLDNTYWEVGLLVDDMIETQKLVAAGFQEKGRGNGRGVH
jgi:hypothetical protein